MGDAMEKQTRGPPEGEAYEGLRREIERLTDNVGRYGASGAFGTAFSSMRPSWLATEGGVRHPPFDMTENEAAYEITGELPDFGPDDIVVKLAAGIVTIRGGKTEKHEERLGARAEGGAGQSIAARRNQRFERTFTLPPGVDVERITAHFVKGVLTVTLPKAADPMRTAKSIAIAPD